MEVRYIEHSGFVIELDSHVLIFDYYKGQLPPLPTDKVWYVFVSHHHGDHYNPEIFQWAAAVPEVVYILSRDTAQAARKSNADADISLHSMKAHESLELEEGSVHIETLRSTDMGVAYVVEIEGKCIYHAGDLNWWHWDEETEAYNNNMAADFKREIDSLRGRQFDLAFLPLDPRQECAFYLGFDYFMSHTATRMAYPMHMWEDISVIGRLKEMECSEPYRDRIAGVYQP